MACRGHISWGCVGTADVWSSARNLVRNCRRAGFWGDLDHAFARLECIWAGDVGNDFAFDPPVHRLFIHGQCLCASEYTFIHYRAGLC